MAIEWTKDLETGNATIDAEHKSLIKAVNDLLSACSTGKGRGELVKAVDFLTQYTQTHFAHEEVLQQKYKYPNYIPHKAFHENYVKGIKATSQKLLQEGPTIAMLGAVNSEISKLVAHIKTEDSKLAKHIKNC